MRVLYLSNHKDVSLLLPLVQEAFGPAAELVHISHPLINPEMDTQELQQAHNALIEECVQAEALIANGDYTLVSAIVLQRAQAGRKTHFITMKKVSAQDGGQVVDGKIVHQNTLVPVKLRAVPA